MLRITVVIILSLLLISCQSHKKKPVTRKPSENEMLEVNRFLVEKDQEIVENFIRRHGWNMERDEAGLWWQVVEKGTGSLLKNGNRITVVYMESLLDGTLCYSGDQRKPKTFRLGYGEWTRGVDEGLAGKHEGDSVRLILPPSLAYGFPGDGNRVPPRSVVVIVLKVLSQQ